MGAMKKYSGLIALFGFLVLLFVLMRRPTVVNGVELGYKAPAGTEDVVRSRVAALGLPVEVERQGELVLVQIQDAKPEDVEAAKRLLRKKGRLEFRPAADRAIQETYKADGVVPEGYEAVELNREDAEYAAWSPKMLIEKACALKGGRILRAEPVKELQPGRPDSWSVSFELDENGSRAFDEAAEKLFARRPPGMIAILLDGKLHSAPVVQTTKFGGSGRITSVGGEREAKELAASLVSGPLPLEIEPQFERPFQKTK